MNSTSPTPRPGAEKILHEIDVLVEELARLAQTQISPSEFYTQLLERAAFTLSAEGAAIWTLAAANELQLSFYQGLPHLKAKRANKFYKREILRLQPIVRESHAAILPSMPTQGLASWLVASPIKVGELTWGILTVHISEDLPLAVKQGYLRFVTELAQIAASYQQRLHVSDWQEKNAVWRGFSDFCLATHQAWSLKEVAFQIANEGRQYVGCDRLGVLLCHRRHCQLLATSGIDAIHSHANLVRKLEQVAHAVSRTHQPFFHDENTADTPPQIESLLSHYMDEGATRNIAIIPLFHGAKSDYSSPKPFAAIVCEQFQDNTLASKTDRLQSVSQQATLALSRAVRVRNVPFLGFLAQHSNFYKFVSTRTWPAWALGLLTTGIIAALLTFVTADFNIVARGEFQPALQRHVFAASDGTVDKLLVKHNQTVEKGEVVLSLRSTDLDLEFQRLSGDIAVTKKELLAVRSEQLQASGFDSDTANRIQALSARELSLSEQLKSFIAQLKILNKQREQLKLTSPIRGQVQTWELESTLLSRPVRRGNILITIADTAGPWVIRLRVPDASAGHVLAAAESSEESLPVSFVSVSEPSKTHSGSLQQISLTSQVDFSKKENGLLIEVNFDRTTIGQLQAGATVVGKIYCGKRSLGYIWLHEFFEEIGRRFF